MTRTTLPMGLLTAACISSCTLNLDFGRFDFPAAGRVIDAGSSSAPGVGDGPGAAVSDRCPAGGAACLDDGSAVGLGGEQTPAAASSSADDAGADAGGGIGAPDPDDAGGPRTCERCTAGENCVAGLCQAAAESCAALKAADPSLTDGVYSITTGGVARRTYCDMVAAVSLCSEQTSDHVGVTRDPSRLEFVLSSVLEAGGCRVWNVRARSDGRPIDALAESADGEIVRPCTPLGFRSDPPGYDRDSGCNYGENPGHGTCGFSTTSPLIKWSNLCSCERDGVDINPGFYDRYVQQGTIFVSVIPWNADGSISVLCGT